VYGGRVVSYLAAATFTWYLNRRITFRHTGRDGAFWQWLKFLGANALGGLLNYGVYGVVVALGPGVLAWIGVPAGLGALVPYAGVAAGSLTGLVVNFVMSRALVFRAAAS